MKIFISWSGDTSLRIAQVFREWLPLVIQSIVPYVSSEDIYKGARWSTDIAKELEVTRYGILCVTKDNIDAPWLNFEAGALSKSLEKTYTSPFLFNLKNSEIDGPLLQFQSTLFTKDDVKKLMIGINSVCDEKIDEVRLEKSYERWWPQLQEDLNKILTEITAEKTTDEAAKFMNGKEADDKKILEEILELARNQYKLLRSPEELFPKDYVKYVYDEVGASADGIHPEAISDMRDVLEMISTLLGDEDIDKYANTELINILKKIEKPTRYIVNMYGSHGSRGRRQRSSLDQMKRPSMDEIKKKMVRSEPIVKSEAINDIDDE